MAVIKPQTSILQVKPLLAVWRAGEELKERDVSVPQFRVSDHFRPFREEWLYDYLFMNHPTQVWLSVIPPPPVPD